jgi:hypothetical protein
LPDEPPVPWGDGGESPEELVPEPPVEVPGVPSLPTGENPEDLIGDSIAL